MQVSQEVFRFIPLQDFTFNSDVDWNNSIIEIDLQLFRKYKLSIKEISFIRKIINKTNITSARRCIKN